LPRRYDSNEPDSCSAGEAEGRRRFSARPGRLPRRPPASCRTVAELRPRLFLPIPGRTGAFRREASMSIATLILGESGTGKSASLRNMDPATTLFIQTIRKPLPFKASGWKPSVTDAWDRIISGINKAAELGKD